LAVAVTILASPRSPAIPISFQVLICPITDLITSDRDTPSEFQFFNGPFNTVPFLRKGIELYGPSPEDRKSELASAQNITPEHAKKQPPTLIISSGVDVLRDDGLLLAETLQKAGVDCVAITAHGQLHISMVLEGTRKGPTLRALMRLVATSIKDALV
jgi:acetyl esterase